LVSSYHVNLIDNGPIVKGANITFRATLYDNNQLAKGSYEFKWEDTAVPTHTRKIDSDGPIDEWTVLFNDSIYPAGRYVAQVTVCKNYLIYCIPLASSRIEFYINETLNGDLQLIQKNKTRNSIFVSNADQVIHNVSLKQSDADLVKQAPTILTYWFVDCTYYGFRKDFLFSFNYTQPDEEHFVEALVVADFTPLPPPTTTTVPTTTTTTTTVKPNTTTTAPTPTTKATTTAAPNSTMTTTLLPTNITKSTKTIVKRDVDVDLLKNETSPLKVRVNGSLVPYQGSFPYVCNGTKVATDPKKTYGYFFKTIKVRVPISKVNVTGNNWLQHGDLLTLNVKCHASKTLKYCVNYEKGVYNVTGNENCSSNYHELEKCEFTIQRYFVESMEHTIVIIIKNESKSKRNCLFVVEVADFNFGQNFGDMEYKTFKERLRVSIANAFFTRAPSPGSSEVPVWPPGRKYGSMTS
ncbi:uncharacterized protein BDFB_003913, partial [Asbolus verrucosus]